MGKEQAEREELMRQLEQERTNKQRILAEFQSGYKINLPALAAGSPSSNGVGTLPDVETVAGLLGIMSRANGNILIHLC